jgi:hypothetical protein
MWVLPIAAPPQRLLICVPTAPMNRDVAKANAERTISARAAAGKGLFALSHAFVVVSSQKGARASSNGVFFAASERNWLAD